MRSPETRRIYEVLELFYPALARLLGIDGHATLVASFESPEWLAYSSVYDGPIGYDALTRTADVTIYTSTVSPVDGVKCVNVIGTLTVSSDGVARFTQSSTT